MSPMVKKIEEEIRKLPIEERVELHEQLISSIYEAQQDLAPEWQAEIQRRASEMEPGKVKGIPAEKVYRKLKVS